MKVHIDPYAGFCFGVRRAMQAAEKAAEGGTTVYSLGDIVHNEDEVRRLEEKGVKAIEKYQYMAMENCHVVIRAHGEPRQTFSHAEAHDITLVDATCPVVKRLQEKINEAVTEMKEKDGVVIIYGKKDHPEVAGLTGQAEGPIEVIQSRSDIDEIDISGPVRVFAQTTMDQEKYQDILQYLEKKKGGDMVSHMTICRQVSGRAGKLREFAGDHDVIVFVSSPSSSNGKYLFSVCRQTNERSYMVNSADEIRKPWFGPDDKVGVSGAASASKKKLEEIAAYIEEI